MITQARAREVRTLLNEVTIARCASDAPRVGRIAEDFAAAVPSPPAPVAAVIAAARSYRAVLAGYSTPELRQSLDEALRAAVLAAWSWLDLEPVADHRIPEQMEMAHG